MDPERTRLRRSPGLAVAWAVAVAVVAAAACDDTGDAAGDQATPSIPAPTLSDPTSGPDDTPTTSGTSEPAPTAAASADQQYPDVLEAELTASGDTWSIAATISSPYDTPERYADAFRVLGPDGTELGVRELLHDHGAEQPFTRSLDGVAIPDDVTEVTVEGRDQANGWGGDTVIVPVPR